jgi:sterol desaturase/sphingolipid hydroxylase (fatty acid hydroxylase superfamily)
MDSNSISVQAAWTAANELLGERVLYTLLLGFPNWLYFPASWLLSRVDCEPGHVLHRYKIGRMLGPEAESNRLLKEASIGNTVNFLMLYFVMYPLEKNWVAPPRADGSSSVAVPALDQLMFEALVQFFLLDTFTYFFHRACHVFLNLWQYHKQHHRWKTPMVMSAVDAHGVEVVIVMVAMLGIRLFMARVFQAHWLSQVVFFTIHTLFAIYGHSGYEFPWFFTTCGSRHFFHHWRNDGCFSPYTVFWDYVFGTDRAYRKWRQKYNIFTDDFGQTQQDAEFAVLK